jgi:hypothetical protein
LANDQDEEKARQKVVDHLNSPKGQKRLWTLSTQPYTTEDVFNRIILEYTQESLAISLLKFTLSKSHVSTRAHRDPQWPIPDKLTDELVKGSTLTGERVFDLRQILTLVSLVTEATIPVLLDSYSVIESTVVTQDMARKDIVTNKPKCKRQPENGAEDKDDGVCQKEPAMGTLEKIDAAWVEIKQTIEEFRTWGEEREKRFQSLKQVNGFDVKDIIAGEGRS